MDIVADVLKQADTKMLDVAMRRLKDMSPQSVKEDTKLAFKAKLDAAEIRDPKPVDIASVSKDLSNLSLKRVSQDRVDLAKSDDPKRKAMLGLETVLATKFVEGMMPKDQSRLYGEGTAGDIWRGMHIEVIGKALAEKGIFSTSKDKIDGAEAIARAPSQLKKIVPFAIKG